MRPPRRVQHSYPKGVSSDTEHQARVIPLPGPDARDREPLWRHIMGDVLRQERLAQDRKLKDVAEAARISMPYLSEIERGRKEASSEVLAAAAHALGLGLADLLGLAQEELARIALARRAGAQARLIPESGRPGAQQHAAVRPGAQHYPRAGLGMPQVKMSLVA